MTITEAIDELRQVASGVESVVDQLQINDAVAAIEKDHTALTARVAKLEQALREILKRDDCVSQHIALRALESFEQ